MKKITLFCLTILSTISFSQTIVNFDVANFTATGDGGLGVGFMNVFDNPKDGTVGGFQFDSGWGIPDLVSVIDASTVTLQPNRIGDTNVYWQTSGVLEGNKLMEANHFVEDVSLRGQNFTFTGNIVSNTLDGSAFSFDYQAIIFIKVFPADFSSVLAETSIPVPVSGDFSLSLDATAYNTDEVIQYGFQVLGPNVNSDPSFDTDYANLGSIVVQPAALSNDEFNVAEMNISPNPTRTSWNIQGTNTIINTIEVFDILGKRIQVLEPNNTEATIDAQDLKSGIYLAKLYSDNGTKTIKLIKE